MQLELSRNEAEVLLKLIQLEMEEINPEIRRAEAGGNMRRELQEERVLLRSVLGRLTEATARTQESVWP